MDNILIVAAVAGLGTFLYVYIVPVFTSATAALNSLPF